METVNHNPAKEGIPFMGPDPTREAGTRKYSWVRIERFQNDCDQIVDSRVGDGCFAFVNITGSSVGKLSPGHQKLK